MELKDTDLEQDNNYLYFASTFFNIKYDQKVMIF